MTTHSPSRSKTAFSLVEMLAALAVIVALGSLIVPALKSARHKADAAKCVSNMRQIGIGMHTYAGENNQRFPKSFINQPGENSTWMWKLIPYVDMGTNSMGMAPLPRSAGIFACASFDPKNPQRRVSYAYNTYIDPITGFPWDYRRNAVPEPSKTFLVVEVNVNGELFSPNSSPDVTRRHPGKTANFLFVDGHVETLTEPVPASDSRWKWAL